MNDYQTYIATSRYARYVDEWGRREYWPETVDRYIKFFDKHVKANHTPEAHEKLSGMKNELQRAIEDMKVMPSMRCLMTAGPALERDHIAGYNCAYVAVDDERVFSEIMYILLCGTGVGFSVERQYVNRLPSVSRLGHSDIVIRVPDSKLGWADSYRQLINELYRGMAPTWETSNIRRAGARLKTFGGRASGPEPLEDLFRFTVEVFRGAEGRRLTSTEVHDIVCKIADIVVVGGVRRSALISLSNLTDERMRHAKSGEWWKDNPQRALANNSVCYTEKPDIGIFMKEWMSLYESKSGERGIYSRDASSAQAARNGRRAEYGDYGTNPCSEIILRSKQFCNLTEVIVRERDTLEALKQKVRWATILGTLQSTLTDFRFLSAEWEKNTKEERLLGVSLTGICDHAVLGHAVDSPRWLDELKQVAIETNKEWAGLLGINQSCAITCVKPSGTVSQLVDSSSGIHPRYSDYYVRRVRGDKRDPLTRFLMDEGVPTEDDVTKPKDMAVFSWPQKAPHGAILRNDVTALEQLELWKVYQEHWCEHKPSITVYVDEHEWLEVGAWVYKHFDIVSGVSFLPKEKHTYRQAPYEEITKERYEELRSAMPTAIDWERLAEYDGETDNTTSSQELACVAGVCDIL